MAGWPSRLSALRSPLSFCTTAITSAAAFTARAAIAALAAFARRTAVLQLGAGFLVDDAHRQADLAAAVDLEQLDLDLLALAQHVADVLDPLILDFRDVDEAVLARHEGHERAEIDDVGDLAGIDRAGNGLGDDAVDPRPRSLDLVEVGGRDLDHALVVDVDLGAGGGDDLADDLAAGADDFADLVLWDGHGLDAGGVSAQFLAGVVERLGHFAENVLAAILGVGDSLQFVAAGDAFTFVIPPALAERIHGLETRELTLGIRPEDVSVALDTGPTIFLGESTIVHPPVTAPACLDLVEALGNEVFVYASIGSYVITARVAPQPLPKLGEPITLAFDLAKSHFFDHESGDRVGKG